MFLAPYFAESFSKGVCYDCRSRRQTAIAGLLNRIRIDEKRLMDIQRICASCTGSSPAEPIQCISLDCEWFYARTKAEDKEEFLDLLNEMVDELDQNDSDADENDEHHESEGELSGHGNPVEFWDTAIEESEQGWFGGTPVSSGSEHPLNIFCE